VATGTLKMPSFKLTGTTGESSKSFGTLVTLSVRGVDKLTGTAANVNAELWEGDTQVVAETQVNAAVTQLSSSLPNTFSGFVLLGNDNFVSATDRGTEYYYVKYPVSWVDYQGTKVYDTIYTYAEETATGSSLFTFYDQNTAESTPNITIGSGGIYTDASIDIKTSSNKALGNPTIPQSFGLCFNESTSGMFKEIRPTSYIAKFDPPGFLRGKNVVDCYVISDALTDGEKISVDLYIEANAGQNPSTSDAIWVIPMDKTYYIDDHLNVAVGWGDDSDLTSDSDIGYDGEAGALKINLA